MAVTRKNSSRPNTLPLRYGVLISTMSILAMLSILAMRGNLQGYIDDKRADTWYTASTITLSTSKESSDDNFRVNSTDTAGASTKKIIASIPVTAISNKSVNIYHDENNQDDSAQNQSQRGNKLLEVAWLMSFPNSGTTYTNHLIQGYTKTTTATNYGQEQSTKNETISVFPDSKNGPFLRYPSWSLPAKYILTKTHCGGECDACQTPGSKQYITSLQAFEEACCTGKRIVNNTKVRISYSSDIPKRAVHLIRDPFDNIVARLHLKERRWGRHHNDSKYEERVNSFNRTKDGFRAYCSFKDINSFKQEFRQRVLSAKILEHAKHVPCYTEFISYTQWHNNAIQLVAQKRIPTMILFYEDYALNWNETVNELLNFLWLKPAPGAEAEKFIVGKHYDEYYEKEEKLAAMELVKELASTDLWKHLQRYFP